MALSGRPSKGTRLERSILGWVGSQDSKDIRGGGGGGGEWLISLIF